VEITYVRYPSVLGSDRHALIFRLMQYKKKMGASWSAWTWLWRQRDPSICWEPLVQVTQRCVPEDPNLLQPWCDNQTIYKILYFVDCASCYDSW